MDGVVSPGMRCGVCSSLTTDNLHRCELCDEKLCTNCKSLRQKLVKLVNKKNKVETEKHCSPCELLISIKSLTGANIPRNIYSEPNCFTNNGKVSVENYNDERDGITTGTNCAPPYDRNTPEHSNKETDNSENSNENKKNKQYSMTGENSDGKVSTETNNRSKSDKGQKSDEGHDLEPLNAKECDGDSLEFRNNLGMEAFEDYSSGKVLNFTVISQYEAQDSRGRPVTVTSIRPLMVIKADKVEYDDKTGLPKTTFPALLQELPPLDTSVDGSTTEVSQNKMADSEVTDVNTTKKKKRKTRQSSKYTCTGCGRRDCQSPFMQLLREMVITARNSGFEICNVVPDGNCMFAAVVDQLEVKNVSLFSPKALRHASIDYLRQNPVSEDGTHYELFLDNEGWDNYLDRMSQDGVWGDHLMLQAIAQVIKQNIQVVHNEVKRNWTVIESKTMDKETSEHIFLGHVGEFHYVSLRPSDEAKQMHQDAEDSTDEDDMMDILQSAPNIPNLDDYKKQEMFTDEYIEPFSDIPAFHMGFILHKLLPLNVIVDNADRVIDTVEDMFTNMNANELPHGQALHVSYEPIGDAIEGLSISIMSKQKISGDEGVPLWEDVPYLVLSDTVIAFPKTSTDAESRDVIVETDKTHPGYAKLLSKYPGRKGESGVSYYIPNNQEYFKTVHDTRSKDSLKNQVRNPETHSLLPRPVGAVTSPFWPEDAAEWKIRTRKVSWPPQSVIDKVVAEGCHYETTPHPKSTNPEIEFRTCFGMAERTIAKSLTREQRYCYIVFRALCSQEFEQDNLITSVHLKSIFFRACEEIASDIWTTKPGACLFYLLDELTSQIGDRTIADYFITSNNLIDHISDFQIQSLSEKVMTLKSQLLSYLTSIAHKLGRHYATNVLEHVREDIILFKDHRNTRESMLQTLVPISLRIASEFIGTKSFKEALEMLQEAYEDRLSVSTCEDSLPFTAFLTQVSDGLTIKQQWWFFLFVDQKLYTTLCSDFSMPLSPVSLDELVGKEVADRFTGTLIPASMAQNLCGLCSDFAYYFYMNHSTSKCVPFLHFAVEKYREKQQNGWQNDQTTDQSQQQAYYDDFTDINIFRVFYQMYVVYHRLNQLWILKEYLPEAERVCEKVNSRTSYRQLATMLEAVGEKKKAQMAITLYNTLPSDGDYCGEEYL